MPAIRAATSVAASICRPGPAGSGSRSPARRRPSPGSWSSSRRWERRPCRAAHSRRPRGSAVQRSPAKAPGRISFSHISSGFCVLMEAADDCRRQTRSPRAPPARALRAARVEIGRRSRRCASASTGGLVELAGEAGQRRVALDPHRLDDRPDLVDERPEVGFGPRHQRVAPGGIQPGEVVKADGSGHVAPFARA